MGMIDGVVEFILAVVDIFPFERPEVFCWDVGLDSGDGERCGLSSFRGKCSARKWIDKVSKNGQ